MSKKAKRRSKLNSFLDFDLTKALSKLLSNIEDAIDPDDHSAAKVIMLTTKIIGFLFIVLGLIREEMEPVAEVLIVLGSSMAIWPGNTRFVGRCAVVESERGLGIGMILMGIVTLFYCWSVSENSVLG